MNLMRYEKEMSKLNIERKKLKGDNKIQIYNIN